MKPNTTDTKNPEQLSGSIPDTVHNDGAITDAIGVPCGYHTRSRLPSREDENDAFAEAMFQRANREAK